jgi:hypothetical protein
MSESIAAGLAAMTWQADGSRASAPAEVARAARYLHGGPGRKRPHVPGDDDARRGRDPGSIIASTSDIVRVP